jgi:hypothetical protein
MASLNGAEVVDIGIWGGGEHKPLVVLGEKKGTNGLGALDVGAGRRLYLYNRESGIFILHSPALAIDIYRMDRSRPAP